MKKNYLNLVRLSILFITFAGSVNAQAISDACTLQRQPEPQGLSMSGADFDKYFRTLQRECELTTRFRNARNLLEGKYGFPIERLTEYQALRYLRRVDYNNAIAMNVPVEYLYQINYPKDPIPMELRQRIIWDNWIEGLTQLAPARQKILNGGDFTVQDLQNVHRGFYRKSTEISGSVPAAGDHAHEADPGHIKPGADNDNFWWVVKPPESYTVRAVVREINETYRNLGLTDSSPDYMNVLQVKTAREYMDYLRNLASIAIPGRNQQLLKHVEEVQNRIYKGEFTTESELLFSGDSRANLKNLKSILSFVNKMFDQAQKNQHMQWNGRLITPAQVAYLAQKFYVGVHPFSEGNGRTSRFIQELVLTSFDMPHGSSGDLMDTDILMSFDQYYKLAIDSNINLITAVEGCIKQYETNGLTSLDSITRRAGSVDYGCRPLR
ncbi:MAG: Fic family protein [Bdellovibrionaceae bacterium]|nr:Fic family protein [Bdellovibrio sp.]